MNANSPAPISRRKWIGPAVLVVLPVAWTVFWFFQLLQRDGTWLSFYDVYLPIFIIGLVLVLAGNVLVRLVWGLFRRGWRWLFGREALRLCFWSALVAISTLALFYNFQWWRGQRAWATVVHEAKQQGEELVDLNTLLGGPIPDDQNFAKAPPFEPLFAGTINNFDNGRWVDTGTNRAALAAMEVNSGNWASGVKQFSWLNGEQTDFQPWLASKNRFRWEKALNLNDTNPAPAVPLTKGKRDPARFAEQMLASLAPFDEPLRQLRDCSSRPFCRFPVDHWDFDRRQMYTLYGFIQVLCLRASAELTLGRADDAFADVELVLRLADYTRQQANFGTPMVLADAVQPVWEGLASRQWNESQLRALQNQLAGLNILGDYPVAWRVEATRQADFLECIIPTGRAIQPVPPNSSLDSGEQTALRVIRWLFPAGWSLHDQATIQRERLRAIADFNRPANPHLPSHSDLRHLIQESDPLFLTFVVPRFKEMWSGEYYFVFAQSAVNQATLACALERFRLARGQYPETLDALVPDFVAALPADVINGQPLKYRRLNDGRFLLYSVGFDHTDDDGQPSPRGLDWEKKPNHEPDLGQGDWVWTYPAGSPAP